MLDRSKLAAGKIQLEEVEFEMHDLLADSLDIFSTVATKKGIGIKSK